jgi:hypothetical protein
MPSRQGLTSRLWLTTTLVLLVSVVISPLRIPGLAPVSSHLHRFRRNIALTPIQFRITICAPKSTDSAPQVKAILYDNEEEEDRVDALDERRVSHEIPHFFRKVSNRPLIARRSILSRYPLRC